MRRTAALPWISLALAVLAVRSAPAEEPPVSAPKAAAPKHVNALASARSPYLRQHAHNPVDWLPWGAEAFAAAKAADKPVFLSIGYAACHWCHVMAHESFEDEATAAVPERRLRLRQGRPRGASRRRRRLHGRRHHDDRAAAAGR